MMLLLIAILAPVAYAEVALGRTSTEEKSPKEQAGEVFSYSKYIRSTDSPIPSYAYGPDADYVFRYRNFGAEPHYVDNSNGGARDRVWPYANYKRTNGDEATVDMPSIEYFDSRYRPSYARYLRLHELLRSQLNSEKQPKLDKDLQIY